MQERLSDHTTALTETSYGTESFFAFPLQVTALYSTIQVMGNGELTKGRGTMRLFIGLVFAVGIGSVVVGNLINIFGGIQDRLCAVGL